MDDPDTTPRTPGIHVACPHCGRELSQWEQVLLSVDKALMCKNCWYRITPSMYESRDEKKAPGNPTKDRR